MPTVQRPAKRGIYVEIDRGLEGAFREFASSRKTSFARELAHAMRRHLAYPPPADPAPLPDAANAGNIGRKKSSKKSAKSS